MTFDPLGLPSTSLGLLRGEIYGCWSREITPLQSGTSIMPEETPRVDKGSGVGGKTIRQACVCGGGGGGEVIK